MFTVMIVEDEILVSIGLKNMINWSDMDMEVIAEAQNGKAALELYHTLKPDLILTDIKMPVMDGIELITRIREIDKKVKIIVLTCYQDYDMLHHAMKHGVFEYILKLKMSPQEMESVIRKVHDELAQEDVSNLFNKYLMSDTKIVKEKVIKDYIISQSCSEQDFNKFVERMKLRIDDSASCVCLMRIENYQQCINNENTKHENTIREAILTLTEEILARYNRGEIIQDKNDCYIILLGFKDLHNISERQNLIQEILTRIHTVLKSYINAKAIFGISSYGDNFKDLSSLHDEAVKALAQSFYTDNTCFIQYNSYLSRASYDAMLKDLLQFVLEFQELSSDYQNQIISEIELLKSMFGAPRCDVQELFVRLIHLSDFNSNVYRQSNTMIIIEQLNKLRECTTIFDTVEVFKQFLLKTLSKKGNTRHLSREVSEVVKFIEMNYQTDISLQQVAGLVQMSANYFSSLFHKELQLSFIEYINCIRVEKAKELLKNTHLKCYDIAQKVGFSDESYFSRIFKRLTGLRPGEFKKQVVIDIERSEGVL